MMRPIEHDFVKRTHWLRWLGYGALACTIAAAAYQVHMYRELSSNLDTWEAKWRSLQKSQAKATSPQPTANLELMQAELKSANRVIENLAMPWDALFKEIELSIDDQITLLNVEPDSEKKGLRITAEGKTLNAMLDYIKRLRTVPIFKDAHVVNHQIQQQDPQRPVRFLVTAIWLEKPKVVMPASSEPLLVNHQ